MDLCTRSDRTVDDGSDEEAGARHRSQPRFTFIMALRPRTDEAKWARTVHYLGETLRSILAQDDPDFELIVAGHDQPDVAELADPRVTFLVADIVRPVEVVERQPDAVRKRQIAAAEAGRRGGGYIMNVDADDLVHHGIVSFVRRDRNPVGYMIRAGYVLDQHNGALGYLPDGVRVPQLWSNCGTCAIFRFAAEDLPVLATDRVDIDETVKPRFYQKFKGHRRWESKMMMHQRFCSTVPFRAVIYRMNSGDNLSADKRKSELIGELLRSTREKPLSMAIKHDQFDG